MRSTRYRAIVVNIKTIKRAAFMTGMGILVSAVIAVSLAVGNYSRGNSDGGEKMVVMNTFNQSFAKTLSYFVLGYDITDVTSAVLSEIPLIKAVSGSSIVAMANSSVQVSGGNIIGTVNEGDGFEQTPLQPPSADGGNGSDERNIDEISAAKYGGVYINNETKYQTDADKLLNDVLNFNFSVKGPKVLIVHTHATEAFSPTDKDTYNLGDSDRSTDTNVNIVKVGEEIARVFKENKIETLHDKKLHDYPSYNGSYQNSLNTIESYKKKYPSIQIVLDVHRDAIIRDDDTKVKLCTEVDGKKAAQVMFVVGTNENGLKHDKWNENLKLAVKMQNKILTHYPGLIRPINLRRERFNQHVTSGSLIIEVGTSGNTLEEAILGARYAATGMADLIKNIK